ncbi:DUF5683 domain-containing protein [uncultured Muribaculum sp.]|nr:DUF5683 domain-containing protein [uncultured Muribaculum sp.]
MTQAAYKPNKHKQRLTIALTAIITAIALPVNVFSTHFDNIYNRQDSLEQHSPRNNRMPVHPHGAQQTSAVATPVPDSVKISAFPDSLWIDNAVPGETIVAGDSIIFTGDSLEIKPEGIVDVDTCTTCDNGKLEIDPDYVVREFNPDPNRAVWLSALFPGLGQLYNRRYWKLPIVAGGFMGLIYGMTWNNQMLDDYTQGYRDLMDNDPSTNSYMDFYPPGTDESKLNKTWLEKTFKSRKDFYRRNRDLCIIGMIGVYLVAMVDAYVDASLTHFDISPDISLDIKPSLIPDTRNSLPGVGLAWAVNF